jgi:hypothetical protein
MGLKVTNNAFGTLNAGINSSVTTIVLSAGEGARFPTLTASDYFYATLIDTSNNLEIVKVTARSTDTMTVVRAQDNTTARAFSANDRFELRPTAALFNELSSAVADGDKGDITVSSTGTVWTIDNQAVTAAKLANTLDLSAKTVTLPAGVGGKILQVVHTAKTSTFSGTSVIDNGGYYIDVTGLSATITPQLSTSKILILTTLWIGVTTAASGYQQAFRLKRVIGATTTYPVIGASEGGRPRGTGRINMYSTNTYFMGMSGGVHHDSPATTSAITYHVQIGGYSGSPVVYLNRSETYQDSSDGINYDTVPVSTITLMEIAA